MSTIEQVRVSAPAEREQSDRERRARTLEAAALEIEVRGHAKGTQMDKDGRVCLYGALNCANGWDGEGPGGLYTPDWATFFPGGWDGGYAVAAWNNAPERTAEEVTFVLRLRAEEVRDGR